MGVDAPRESAIGVAVVGLFSMGLALIGVAIAGMIAFGLLGAATGWDPLGLTTESDTAPAVRDAGCHASHEPCLHAEAVDYDCAGGSGDGPRYVAGSVRVTGPERLRPRPRWGRHGLRLAICDLA